MSLLHREPPKITLDQLKAHPYFKSLTTKQRIFLVTYLETDDRIAAVTNAYGDVKRPENLAVRCLASPNIKRLIGLYYGTVLDQGSMGRSELASLVATRLRNSKVSNSDFFKLANLLVDLRFPAKKKPSAGDPDATSVSARDDEALDIDELVQKLEAGQLTKRT